MYFVVMISSVSGALKVTFLAAGNIGRDCVIDNRRLRVREIGPFVRIDRAVKGSL